MYLFNNSSSAVLLYDLRDNGSQQFIVLCILSFYNCYLVLFLDFLYYLLSDFPQFSFYICFINI